MNITSFYAPVSLDSSSIVGEHCVLGYPKEARLRAEQQNPGSSLIGDQVTVGPKCLLANHVVIYEGVQIGADCGQAPNRHYIVILSGG